MDQPFDLIVSNKPGQTVACHGLTRTWDESVFGKANGVDAFPLVGLGFGRYAFFRSQQVQLTRVDAIYLRQLGLFWTSLFSSEVILQFLIIVERRITPRAQCRHCVASENVLSAVTILVLLSQRPG